MDPALGRFVSRDPLGLWADALGSGFTYASSNPFNRTDPFGEMDAPGHDSGGWRLRTYEGTRKDWQEWHQTAGASGGPRVFDPAKSRAARDAALEWTVVGTYRESKHHWREGSRCFTREQYGYGTAMKAGAVIIFISMVTDFIPGKGAAKRRGAREVGEAVGEVVGRHLDEAVEGVGESKKVYRGLAEGEDIAEGLTARKPGAGNSPMSHVAGKRDSQWISTTKDPKIAVEKYGEHGVCEIDLDKVGTEVVDVSGGFGGKAKMLSAWAKKGKEVLIKDRVPAGAVKPFTGPQLSP